MSTAPVVTALAPAVDGVRRAAAAVRWWARELTGEARWDDYLAACARTGEAPVDRRTFERGRDAHREHAARGRCC